MLRHVVRAIRSHWPAVDILVRGDSHYARPEAMSWLERNRVGYVFGLAGNQVLLAKVGTSPRTPPWPRRGRGGQGPPLRRIPLCRQDLARRAAGHRPGRGLGTGQRQPVHRHQPQGHAALAVRGGLLRPRPSRESDQGAQAAPRLRSDVVQQGHGQPVPAADPHRRLLAAAHPARPGAQDLVLARRPVRHHPARADQGRRPCHRDGHPDQGRAAVPLPLQDSLALLAARAAKLPP